MTLDAGSRVDSARLVMTADNEFVCCVNGRRVGSGDNFNQAYAMNVASALEAGREPDRRAMPRTRPTRRIRPA